jgi:hypothetical protein
MPKKKKKAKKTRTKKTGAKKARAKKPRAKKPRAKKPRAKKPRAKKARAKRPRTKKRGLRLAGALKSRLRVHGHDLPTCAGNSHHASCVDKERMLSCNQVTILGKSFAVCTHLR